MATSEARIAANRKNAERATGPRTVEGKNRSRANSLKHGLTAIVLRTAEEVEVVGEPTPRPPGELGSSPLDREWVYNEVSLLTLRVQRAGEMEDRLRERSAFRASTSWEADRRSEAESIGSRLRKKPAEFADRLQQTPEGCLWMIERWAMLARAADRDGGWSPEAHALAFDLLGTPHELRGGATSEQIDSEGQVTDPGQDLGEFARLNVDRLIEIHRGLLEVDAFDRETAQAGLAFDLGAEGLRLHRYEAAIERRLRWYHGILERLPDDPDGSKGPARTVEQAPEAIDAARRDEVQADLEALPLPPTPSRKERRALKVESRRLAESRKLARRLE